MPSADFTNILAKDHLEIQHSDVSPSDVMFAIDVPGSETATLMSTISRASRHERQGLKFDSRDKPIVQPQQL